MNGATDFSEHAQSEAANVYAEVIQSIQSFSEGMIKNFGERIKSHPYKQLENVANTFIKYYNESLPQEIKSAISNWISSDNSFRASLSKHYESDEASASAANSIENSLLDEVDSCFKNIEDLKISKPISVNKEMILEDANFTEDYYKALGNLKEDWSTNFMKFAEDNSLYATMMPMLNGTFINVEKVYDAAKKDLLNVGDEFANAWSSVISSDSERGREIGKTRLGVSGAFSTDRRQRR